MPDTPVASPDHASLAALEDHGAFVPRHIGPDAHEQAQMLGELGFASRAALIDALVPPAIRRKHFAALRAAQSAQRAQF